MPYEQWLEKVALINPWTGELEGANAAPSTEGIKVEWLEVWEVTLT